MSLECFFVQNKKVPYALQKRVSALLSRKHYLLVLIGGFFVRFVDGFDSLHVNLKVGHFLDPQHTAVLVYKVLQVFEFK